MRLRRVGACVVVVLALAGLSACRTKAGAAAFVDGHRISEGDVTKYLEPGYTPPAATSNSQAPQPPRALALNTIIEARLMTALLQRSLGGVPADSDLASLHDEALSVQVGIQATGSQADAQLLSVLTKAGMKPSFASVLTRDIELKQVVIDKIQAQQQSDIGAAVKKLGIPVSISGRYGTWSIADAGIVASTPPDFLKLDSATPAPAGG